MEERDKSVKSSRELVEKTFIDLGFTNENPRDLDLVNDLLQRWLHRNDPSVQSPYNPFTPGISSPDDYTPEEWALLNDEDVQIVLNKCKEYYEPKEHLTSGDLKSILEQIALGTLTRQTYDFKSGLSITETPSFGERLTAIKMLQGQNPDDTAETVQFINNIGLNGTDLTDPTSDPNDMPKPDIKPNMDNVNRRIKELEAKKQAQSANSQKEAQLNETSQSN